MRFIEFQSSRVNKSSKIAGPQIKSPSESISASEAASTSPHNAHSKAPPFLRRPYPNLCPLLLLLSFFFTSREAGGVWVTAADGIDLRGGES